MAERSFIRILVAITLCVALMAFASVPVPQNAKGKPDLPKPAFGQPGLYRLETCLLVFYGGLLLITPAFSGLIRGRLPIEISTRGARFPRDTDQSAEATKAALEKLEQTAKSLRDDLVLAHAEIGRLKEGSSRDSRQLEIDSEP